MEIKHDFHIHTERSLCANRDAYARDYVKLAKEMGLKKIGFADHFWDEAYKPLDYFFYEPQNYAHVATILDELKEVDTDGIEVFFGCEAEYSHEHGVGITEETAEKFDFIVVPNSHTHKTMSAEFSGSYDMHADFMIRAYYNIIESPVSKYILSMAHPFSAVACPYDNNILKRMITDDAFKRMFDRTAEKGIAVEINTDSFKYKTKEEIANAEEIRMFNIARECGCKFTFGSDCHNVHEYKETYPRTCAHLVEVLGLKEDDLKDFVK